MIEIAKDPVLGPELRLRGGTCLHKLHLETPWRYSEDLDYVRSTHSGIKPYVAALRAIAGEIGLDVSAVNTSGQMVHVILDAEPTTPPGRIRIKIETNIAETIPYHEPITIPHTVDSPWWSGRADIPTFIVEEMLGTKLRALYQRSKGRDLFDHWVFLTTTQIEDAEVVDAFHHYMGDDAFTYPELAQNLAAKLADGDFGSDVEGLVLELPAEYVVVEAADLFMERIGSKLRNAPPLEEIESGRWRAA
jgi:predicted nucleotidyltransferase component of viral defense system